MNRETVSRIVSQIDGKYIDEAAMPADTGEQVPPTMPRPAGRRTFRPLWAGAACLVLCLALGSAALACAAEVREYRAAVTFFTENGLSPEGLSRAEVKAVYRDITTKRFSYGKTAEVLLQTVSGWEIRQDEPTPEELAALWDRSARREPSPARGIGYRREAQYVYDEKRGFEVFDKSVVECLQDGNLLWQAEFGDFYADGCAHTPEGTAVWGWHENLSSDARQYAWFARVDDSGNILWQQWLNHGFQREHIAAVLSAGDGAWAVLSKGDRSWLCLSLYNMDGKELSFRKTDVGNYGIWNAARLGDGYIVQLGNSITGDTALLYRLDREGNVLDSYSYEAEDCVYHITDMAEFGGQVFLSAYAVPPQTDEGGRHEIADVLDGLFSREDYGVGITSEELTPILRRNYTAVLLLCDPEGGSPRTFYSVEGSLGGALTVSPEGRLEWDVQSITSSFFSPATSAFSIGGTCSVFRYTFDEAGALLGQADTGETVRYAR